MNRRIIKKDYERLKFVIEKNIQKEKYDLACHYIQCAGKLAWNACICFSDETLENMTKYISTRLIQNGITLNKSSDDMEIIFIDTVCADVRGLGYIYVNALLEKGYKVRYLYLKSKKDKIGITLNCIKNNESSSANSIDDSSIVTAIVELFNIIKCLNVKKILVNCGDTDVIPCAVLYRIKNVESYRISYGDHTFNLGTSIYKYIIEFRDVGVYITNKCRKVKNKQIVKIPYYPNKLPELKYEGLPFSIEGKKLLVSGGQIYKTVDSNHTFYNLVRTILNNHSECVFLMLSNGSTKGLEDLIREYPDRAFHIRERKDLNEILKRATLYISTYPVIGALMIQYAVMNNRIPVTFLKDATMQSGVLLNEDSLNIYFDNAECFIKEIDRLLEDDDYRNKQEQLLDGQIIRPEVFADELNLVLQKKGSGFPVGISTITVEQIQSMINETLQGIEAYLSYLGAYPRIEYKYMIKKFPLKTIIGVLYKSIEKIKYKFQK